MGGDFELNLEKGELFGDVIMPVVSLLETIAREGRKNIRWLGVENVPSFDFDERKMKHVFINLITNAIKYSRDNTDIFVEGMESLGAVARVVVSNEGIGILEGWEEKIFDRDIRAPNALKGGYMA